MNPEAHRRAIKESLEIIAESVRKGLEKRQRTIGFHCSAAAVDMLELWLHDNEFISTGMIIKHDWFSSLQNARRRIATDFRNKDRILRLLVDLESKRNVLCYGKSQTRGMIEDYLERFNQIKEILVDNGLDYE